MSKRKSFVRVFTEGGPLIALAVAIALLIGIVGPASAQFFNFGNFGGTPATATPRRRRLVRRRLFRTVPTANTGAASAEASGAPADTGGFFEGAAAREARDRAGAQPAGARRCDGRLARLWS